MIGHIGVYAKLQLVMRSTGKHFILGRNSFEKVHWNRFKSGSRGSAGSIRLRQDE